MEALKVWSGAAFTCFNCMIGISKKRRSEEGKKVVEERVGRENRNENESKSAKRVGKEK